MENGSVQKWRFQGNEELGSAASVIIRGFLDTLNGNVNKNDTRLTIPLGHGDPSAFPSFQTTIVAQDAIVNAVRSSKYNHYSPIVGILPAIRVVADYLNRDLPYKLSPDDVYLTVGCKQAIEVILTVLARPGANILLPRPGFPTYEAYTRSNHLEVRYIDLLPEKGWEVDLDAVETLVDENTVAIVIIMAILVEMSTLTNC